VQGSLNADELKAVNDVLGQVNTLATQFFAGNLAQAFASAATLGVDPTEIAGLALHLSERTSLVLASVGEGGTAPAAGPAATPSATPVDPATTVPATGAADASASDATPAATTSVAAPPAATSAAGGGSASLFDYLQQVLDAIGTSTTSGSVTFSARAKLELLASAVGAASITPAETTAAGVLRGFAAATTDGSATAATAATSATGTASA
jgi:hypothetical protein